MSQTEAPTPTGQADGRPSPRATWLAPILLRSNPGVLLRLKQFRQRLRRLSVQKRRWLMRRAAVTMAGAALLLALSSAPAMPDVITVANGEVVIADNGKCSLIEAIRNANNTVSGQPHDDCAPGNPSGADTIRLPNNGEFVLTQAHNSSEDGSNGLPWIGTEITIQGRGSTIRRADGAPEFRFFAVGPEGSLVLDSVTLRNGDAGSRSGGAILNQGALEIQESNLTGNRAFIGGGVSNSGALQIIDSALTENRANSAGAISNADSFYVDGIIFDPSVDIHNSVLSNNEATTGFGGAIRSSSSVTIHSSIITGNSSAINGGAFTIEEYVELVLVDSEISGNSAGESGGAISTFYGATVTVLHSTLTGNSANSSGGAIELNGDAGYGGQLNVEQSEFMFNSASSGGAIASYQSSINISYSTFSNNNAARGGGAIDCVEGTLKIQKGLLAENSAVSGGGLTSVFCILEILDTTLSGNVAADGGGIFIASDLGGFDYTGRVLIAHTTVTGNSASSNGGGIMNYGSNTTIRESIVTGNSGDVGENVYNAAQPNSNYALPPQFHSRGHNIFGASSSAGLFNVELDASDLVPTVKVDSIIATLADNGGPTQNHAIIKDSPAIDVISSSECLGQVDQRGFPRNVDGDNKLSTKECDIGAFEFDPNPPTATPTATTSPTATSTPRPTNTPSPTPSMTPTGTVTPSMTPTGTITPPADTPTPTTTPEATNTPEPSPTPTATATRPPNLEYSIYLPLARSDLPYLPRR